MHFDDRLETVLQLPDSGDTMARIQFLQLVDIVGSLPESAGSEVLDLAFQRLEALHRRIPPAGRARLLRQPRPPIANPRLLAGLVEQEPEVASAAIACAALSEAQWLVLIPRLPVRARGILRHRRDLSPAIAAVLEQLGIHDRGLPPVSASAEAQSERVVMELLDALPGGPPPQTGTQAAPQTGMQAAPTAMVPAAASPAEAGIGAIVRRIEEFRKARVTAGEAEPGTPRETVAAAPPHALSIDFATDAEGRIDWADGPHAPSVIGLGLAAATAGAGDAARATAVRHRQPLSAVRLRIDGAAGVTGDWQVDAVPRFDTASGRFTGYCGRLRRLPSPGAIEAAPPVEADRMREILHELRTPANAIQVAAEIIQQQLYGPAPHEYRALAAAIAGDCAHILAGFEELDRLVKLETGALALDVGQCDLAQIVAQTVSRLRSWTEPRRSGFAVDPATGPTALPARLDQAEAERLVWRLFAALAGATAPDEILPLTWRQDHTGRILVRVAMPASLAARDDGDEPSGLPKSGDRGQALSAGMFGLDFTLRLAAAEAVAAGGALLQEDNALNLWLPGLTPADAGNSNRAGGAI